MGRSGCGGSCADRVEVAAVRIELTHLTVIRPGGLRALDDLSCAFDSARCAAFAVLGANGAGKSTLLESVLGLTPAASGEVSVDGVRLEKRSLSEIRRKVGMIFQNADDQLFSQTVREDVAFGPGNLGLAPGVAAKRTEEALELLGVSALAERDVNRLSGGEKRRVALAGVLAMNPGAVLLDEPTSMLDPRGCRELCEHLRKLPALKIVATHDLAFAERLCPECIILKNGRIHAAGATAELLRQTGLLLSCGLA